MTNPQNKLAATWLFYAASTGVAVLLNAPVLLVLGLLLFAFISLIGWGLTFKI